jgi:hypothetical protein
MTAAADVTLTIPRLHPAQARVVREARRFNVLMCGRRWGKTLLGEDRAIDPALDGLPVGWFAPTYKFLEEPFRDCARILADVAQVNRAERRIELVTGGRIDFWSMDDPNAGRGRKYARAVIDEAGIVRDLQSVWPEAIRPTLTDYRGDAWFLGTPKGRNYFTQLHAKGESGDPDWRSWRMGTASNPYIDPAEVEAARHDLPDAVFRQEYLGEPADDGGNPFGLSAIRACVAPLSDAPPVAWGWDLAKSMDFTVGVALDAAGVVCRFDRWQGESWQMTTRKILSLTAGATAYVDSTGVGDPIVETLQRERPEGAPRGAPILGYSFTARSKQQLMEGLAVAIQRGEVRFPDGPITRELEQFEYEYTRTGVRYSAPEGLHDDCVIALALAVLRRAEWQRARPLASQPGAFPVIRARR